MLRLLARKTAERALLAVLENLDLVARYAAAKSNRFREILRNEGIRDPRTLTPEQALYILVKHDIDLASFIDKAPVVLQGIIYTAIETARAAYYDGIDVDRIINGMKNHDKEIVRRLAAILDTEAGRQWLRKQLKQLI